MNTKNQFEKAGLADTTTWSGNMELANNTGSTINSVTLVHACLGNMPAVVTAQSLADNGDSAKVSFATTAGNQDYWLVSFVDNNGKLTSGHLGMPFHIGSEGSTVEVSLLPGNFIVTISGVTGTGHYDRQ